MLDHEEAERRAKEQERAEEEERKKEREAYERQKLKDEERAKVERELNMRARPVDRDAIQAKLIQDNMVPLERPAWDTKGKGKRKDRKG